MIALVLLACQSAPVPQGLSPDEAALAYQNCEATGAAPVCYELAASTDYGKAFYGLSAACFEGYKDACRRGSVLAQQEGRHRDAVLLARRGCHHGEVADCRRVLTYAESNPEAADVVGRLREDVEAQLAELEGNR